MYPCTLPCISTTWTNHSATRVADSEVFAWSRSRIPNNIWIRSRIFCPTPTPDVQLDHFLHHNPKLGIPIWNGTMSFETFVETDISCCAPRFPLILTVKFHSLYVKESESEILESPESGVGNFGKVGVGVGVRYFTSNSAALSATLNITNIKKAYQEFCESLLSAAKQCIPRDGLRTMCLVSPHNSCCRTGHTRPGTSSTPGTPTRSFPIYGRSQHLRETVSLASSCQRSLLPLSGAWSQESLRVWIISSLSL